MPVSIKMTIEQKDKLQRLGGPSWVRERIDKAREPESESGVLAAPPAQRTAPMTDDFDALKARAATARQRLGNAMLALVRADDANREAVEKEMEAARKEGAAISREMNRWAKAQKS